MRKVLIVDDNNMNRMILGRILRDDYEVLEAENGRKALDILEVKFNEISAVLLDIGMPVMDGYEVLEAMRSSDSLMQIPVIVTTGDKESSSEMKALSLGANDFALKPYNAEIIKRRLWNLINLRETSAIVNATRKDALTGLYSRSAFFEKSEELIADHEAGYYVMGCFDIDKFKVINDQYGSAKGDAVLKAVADIFKKGFASIGGICCRIAADNFAVLYPLDFISSDEIREIRRASTVLDGSFPPITFSIGRYIVDDKSLPPSAMYDRAAIAKASVKGRFDVHIAKYDESMRKRILREQEITNEMDIALENNNFEVWFQPQYNHSSGALIGAEALVRWHHPQKGLISPGDFIPVFEKNGFIYELDKYVWRHTCALLRKWLDAGRSVTPVSVNISRCDIFRSDLIDVITNLTDEYDIPSDMLRLEITESAFAQSTDMIIKVVENLIALGFTVEIDDFGSGYSSLNTLKNVPAQVIKLDMRFLEGDDNSARGGNIIESVVRMTKWLGVSVIAEGVETLEQADYLKSIGCNYIQGYLYAKPMPADEYEKLSAHISKEERMLALETVESLDNNAFWNPKSMETLIFNSYVGGACIFEYSNGKIEMLRANDKYAQVIGEGRITVEDALNISWGEHLDEKTREHFISCVDKAVETKDEVTGEFLFINLPGCAEKTYLRSSLRVIASTAARYLVYCTTENVTAQRNAEIKEREIAEHLSVIMANINGGVSAVTMSDDGTAHFIFANDRYYQMLGYSKAIFIDEKINPFDIIHPDDRVRIVEQTVLASRDNLPFSCTFRAIKRSGEVILIQSNISMTTISGVDRPVQIAVANDITAQCEAELKERKSSEQVRAIMDNIESGIIAVILNNNKPEFVFSNDKYYEIFGYTREQYQKEVTNTLELIHPDDRQNTFKAMQEVVQTGRPSIIEYRASRRDGKEIWTRAVMSSTHFDGIDVPVQLSIVRDISVEKAVIQQLNETDEQLRFLNETAHELLAQTDSDKAIQQVLHRLLNYFGGNRVYIFEFNYEADIVKNTYEVCSDKVVSEKKVLQNVPMRVMDFWISSFKKKNYISIKNVDALGEKRAEEKLTLQKQGIKSLVAVPLRRDGQLIGFIGIDDPSRQQSLVERFDALGDYITVMLTRRDLDRKIRSDNEALANLMNDTPGGFARFKVMNNGRILMVNFNEGYCKLLGMTRDELIEQYDREDAMQRLHPDDVKLAREAVSNLLTTEKETASIKYRLRRKNGEYIWLLVFGRITKTDSGEAFLTLYYADLEEESKRNVSFSETLPFILEAIMKLSSSLAFAKDKNLKYICCSKTFAKSVGENSIEEVIGKTDYDLFDKEKADKYRNDDARVFASGESIIDMIEAIPSDDGITHYSRTSKYILKDTLGNTIGIYGVGQDITEYRTAFEQLKFLTNNIPGGLAKYKASLNGIHTLYLSDGVYEMSGYPKEEYDALTKNNAMRIVFDEDVTDVRKQFIAMLKDESPINCLFRIHLKNGGFRWVNLRGTMSEKRTNTVVINAVLFDVTDGKLAEERLLKSQSEMALTNQLISDSSTAVCVCDAESHKLLYINSKCAEMCGKNASEACGETCYKFMKDRDTPCEPCNMKSSNDSEYSEREFLNSATGRYYIIRYKFIDWNGRRALVEYLNDETELIKAQKDLRDLVNGIPCGVGIYNFYPDKKLEMVYLNDGYYSLIGIDRAERHEYSGFSVVNAIHPDDVGIVTKKIRDAVENNKLINFDLRIHTKENQYRWFNIKAKVAYRIDNKTVLYAAYSDIDNVKRSQLQLEASRRLLDMANREGRISLWLFDIEKRRITCEISDSTLFGYEKSIDNVPAYFIENNIVIPEDEAPFVEMYQKLFDGAERCECTVRMLNKSTKHYGWQHITYTRLYDSYYEGQIAVGICANVDVEQEIRRNYEHELHLRQEMVKDSIIYYELNLTRGVVEEYNSRYDDVPSLTSSPIINETMRSEILKNIAEEDREKVRNTIFSNSLLKSYNNRKTNVTLEYRRLIDNSDYHWVKAVVTMTKRPDSDEIIAFLYAKDIDAEKKMSLALDSIIDREIESVAITNVKTKITRLVSSNGEHKSIDASICYNHDEVIMNFIIASVVKEDKRPYADAMLLKNLIPELDKNKSVLLTFRMHSRDGTIKRKRLLAFYLDDTREDIIVSSRDITRLYEEEQRQKQALREAVDAANEANRAKSEFLSRMSHDMRTPLNAVIGMVNLAKDENNPPQTTEYLENIDTSSHFLLGLINDVLDLGKIESGKIELHEEPFGVEEFKRSICTVINPMMENRNITFVSKMECGATNILVDKLRFSQIFFNLLSNAAKYTNEGGHVEFAAVHIPGKDGKTGMRFFVRDDGIGISDKFMRIMFDPFSQERTDSNADIKGSGLGLAIVKNLVEAMGGKISVKSELGKGTEFTVDLYAKEVLPSTEKKHCLNVADLSEIRVLLVEDNKMNVIVAKKLLEKKGCTVELAVNGKDGVEKFTASAPDYYDAILMDIRMPVMNGIDASKAIRKADRSDAKSVPIIAMTADAFSEDEQISLDAGMNEHISKPIEPDILFETLGRLTAQKHTADKK